MVLTPEERAQRLLDGREGWHAHIRDAGGGYVVCEVVKIDEEEDAPYAWISDSEEEAKPYEVGIYLPAKWQEAIAIETVSESALERHVFAELARAAGEEETPDPGSSGTTTSKGGR